MTDLDVLEELQDLFGGSICRTAKQKSHHKDAWAWTLNGSEAEAAMLEVRKYMFARRSEKIDEVLEAWSDVKKERVQRKNQATRKAILAASEYQRGGISLRAVGEKYGISHESVRQLVKTSRGGENLCSVSHGG